MTDWCILRTSGRSTIRLTESLAKDGFDVWTPIETRTVRVPRANIRRKVRLPIMPSYVFARARHVVDLLAMSSMPLKPRSGAGVHERVHAGFRVVHGHTGIPLIADRYFHELRKIEHRLTPGKAAVRRTTYSFPRNASARVKGGIFGGMVGVVVRSTPTKTVLRFNHGFPVEVPTTILALDDLSLAPKREG